MKQTARTAPRTVPAFAEAWDVKPYYATRSGIAFHGDARTALKAIPDQSVQLIMTSPPFALLRKKDYGNVAEKEYVDWFLTFIPEFKRVLADDGSLVIDIGGSWKPGVPTRSLYHYKLVIDLVEKGGLHLAQDFFWFNPAKLPSPAEWVNVQRIRVKDAVDPVWWLSKSERPKADNRRVLAQYSEAMERLFKSGYVAGKRPSGWDIHKSKFLKRHEGAIPPNALIQPNLEAFEGDEDISDATARAILGNFLSIPNTDSNSRYLKMCREHGVKAHPARFPAGLPEFFIKYLTDEDDVVLDPFGGSNMTGMVAEQLGRKWIAVDMEEEYLQASAFRFEDFLERPPPYKFKRKAGKTVKSDAPAKKSGAP